MEMVLSLEPVQMLFVYGCHTTAFTESMWPLKVCLHRPLFASQRRAEWSREHDTMKSPVSWKAASHTACVCSVKVCVHLDCSKPHILTVQSPDADTRAVPLGWKFTLATQSLCPSPLIMMSPLGRPHIFHVQSSDAVTIMGFFGWIATFETDMRCPLKVFCSVKFWISATGNCRFWSGFSRSLGGSWESPFFFGVFFGLGAGSVSIGCVICVIWVSIDSSLAAIRSLSKRTSIFSFIATSYLCLSSLMVGS
mmetsp:Transcript_23475/g.39312  ORF Transcript_23475/g.39312 Transcript_23475/m.39312 type:complete len:251 (+) Transcript_23475:992-1744(+)